MNQNQLTELNENNSVLVCLRVIVFFSCWWNLHKLWTSKMTTKPKIKFDANRAWGGGVEKDPKQLMPRVRFSNF